MYSFPYDIRNDCHSARVGNLIHALQVAIRESFPHRCILGIFPEYNIILVTNLKMFSPNSSSDFSNRFGGFFMFRELLYARAFSVLPSAQVLVYTTAKCFPVPLKHCHSGMDFETKVQALNGEKLSHLTIDF